MTGYLKRPYQPETQRTSKTRRKPKINQKHPRRKVLETHPGHPVFAKEMDIQNNKKLNIRT